MTAESNQLKLERMRVYRGPNLYARSPVVVTALRDAFCPALPVGETMHRLRSAWTDIEVDWPQCNGLARAHAYALLIARATSALLNNVRGYVRDHGAMPMGRSDALLWVGYHRSDITASAMELATRWVAHAAHERWLLHIEDPQGSAIYQELISQTNALGQMCARFHPDWIARVLMMAAESANIPVQRATMQPRTWQYGWGSRSATFFEASSIRDSVFATHTSRNKFATAALLKSLGYPQSDPKAAGCLEEARKWFSELGSAVVVKPPDGGKGRGVTVNVRTAQDLERAFELAMSESRVNQVLVERVASGQDHRLLVVRGKLVAASRREPASVRGDGKATLRQLVDQLNAERQRDPVKRRYLKKVSFDAAATHHIGLLGMTPDSVPGAEHRVFLRGNANVSSGGTPEDVLHLVHPDVKTMAESLAVNLGLSSVGIDYMATDISRPWHEVGGVVIEVNTTPGLDVHLAVGMDEVTIGRIVLGEDIGPIPVVLIVCSADRIGFWEQQLAADTELWPANTALVTPGLAQLGAMPLLLDGNLYARVEQCLANQTVSALVVVSPVETVLAAGLPVPISTLAIVDTPFTDERDVERQMLAQHCSDILDLGRALVQPSEAFDRLRRALAREPGGWDSGARSACTGHGPGRKHRAGEIELDVLRYQALSNDPVVFSVVRNAAYLLPHFLNHYRSLGPVQFVFFDDQSSDGTREVLLQQPDATVLASPHRFHHRMSNGKQLHNNLRNWVPDSLGPGRWVITVDIDEFLILPTETPTISSMADWLDSRGHTTALASMIDFYPRQLSGRRHPADISPFVASPFFDVSKGFSRDESGRVSKAPGGIRWRLQEWLRTEQPEAHRRIFAGQGYARGASWKSPFVKTGTDTWLINAHSTNCLAPVDLELALAHFKFHPDADAGIAEALSSNAHYHGSIEYHFLKAAFDAFEDRDLMCDDTRRFEGGASIEKAGLCWLTQPGT